MRNKRTVILLAVIVIVLPAMFVVDQAVRTLRTLTTVERERDTWQRPDDLAPGEGQPGLLAREVVLVEGPRPGRPGENGRFVMEICRYGHVDGWWLTPLD